MIYFAYASNLNPEQMRERAPDHRRIGLAVLRDYRIAFPRYSPLWGGGVASPQLAHGEELWGVLFEVTEHDLERLDVYEGFRAPGDQHNIYERQQEYVELVRAEDGSVPRRVRAHVYFAHVSNPKPPSRRYLDAILKGARAYRLPEDYIAKLETIAVAEEEAGAG
jgi:hypothetical protein